jgi:hypothetical protein
MARPCGQSVEIDRQGRHQGLALAVRISEIRPECTTIRRPAARRNTQTERTARGFTANRERFGQDLIERGAFGRRFLNSSVLARRAPSSSFSISGS